MTDASVSVAELLRQKSEAFFLELLNDGADLARTIDGPSLSSPGLVLAGYCVVLGIAGMLMTREREIA